MNLNDIMSTDTGRKALMRVGRGPGSGKGKTCGRGQKGEGARSGGKNRGPLFEGGQFPFWMRLPKRGFTNARHTTRYQAVSFARMLERVEADQITLDTLVAAGLARPGERVKLVSGVKTERQLTITINRVTKSVREAVEAAGGSVEQSDA